MMSCTHCPRCAWKAITSITFSALSSSFHFALSCWLSRLLPVSATQPAPPGQHGFLTVESTSTSKRGQFKWRLYFENMSQARSPFNPTTVSRVKGLILIAAWPGTTLSSLPWLPLPLLSLACTDGEILLHSCTCVTSSGWPNTAVTQMRIISFPQPGQMQGDVWLCARKTARFQV